MKKPLFLICLLIFISISKTFSQDFLGLNTGNYAGITGVTLQPASIVDSRFKFDINVISTSVNYSNNYFLVDRDVILKFNKNNFDNYSTFKNKYLSLADLPAGQKVFFNINNRVQLPLSFMVTTGKKSALALNLQFRNKIQARGITQELASLAFNNFYSPPLNNTSINASGISIGSLSWAEAGLTYGRVLYSSEKHFLKAAFTGKYLAGVSSLDISSNDLRLQVNSDSTFNFNSSGVSYNHNKNADFNKLFDKSFSADAKAFGFDAGLVYEYRGNINSKYLRNDDEESYLEDRRDLNKYLFKLGVSLLDAGMFRFNKPSNVNSFSAAINNWDLKNAGYGSLSEFDTALARQVVPIANDPRSYNVYLPTALSAQLDVRFVRGLFLNVMSYWPVKMGSAAGERFDKYGYYTITPRYERRHFGVYLPYTVSQRNDFTDYKQNMLGASIRLGPFFIGSSNLGTMLFNKKLKAADVFVGLKVGFTYGKPDKSTKVLEKVFSKNQTVISNPSRVDLSNDTTTYISSEEEVNPNTKTKTKITQQNFIDTSKVLMNYKNGNIFNNPDAKGNIIIINNYYNNEPGTALLPSVTTSDSVYEQRLFMESQRNKMLSDSISKATYDTLKMKRDQLDTLIKSMQQLRMQMDSNSKDQSLAYPPAVDNYDISNDTLHGKNVTVDIDTTLTNTAADYSMQSDTLRNKIYKGDTTNRSASISGKKKGDSATAITAYKEKDNVTKNDQATQTSFKQQTPENYYSSAGNGIRKNSADIRRMQEEQDEQFRQYANQASGLQNEIDRLNRRLASNKQYNGSDVRYVSAERTRYVPYYNNYTPPNNGNGNTLQKTTHTDTIYLRDTVSKHSTDTITNVIVAQPTKPASIQQPALSSVKDSLIYTELPAEIILFGVGRAAVQPIYNARLDFLARVLTAHRSLSVTITGHTDSTGPKIVNEKLSLQRAESVAKYLKNKGMLENQVIIKSASFEDPAVPGTTKTARSQNRRVVVKLVNK